MADGSEWTVAELAEKLGVRTQNVWMALVALLTDGTAHVAGKNACSGSRRSARVFSFGAGMEVQESCVESALWWPQADLVVVAAFDAMVRCL
ncbi:hypothetical protein SAMN05446935_7457 [Burkholderia sp. YR290]|nr:hypothetical protein SAMN05446935_7457 [Burkholderia sp. YR290]